MARSSFFSRLLRGRLNRWEQSLVGGVVGLICGLLICGAIVLTSPAARGPNALTVPEAALLFGSMGAGFGIILGARAGVYPFTREPPEAFPGHSEGGDKDWIVAFIWPTEHSTPDSLQALGRELEAWRTGKAAVTRITGLERLLSGRFPPPDGPTPYIDDPEGELMPRPGRNADGPGIEFRRMSVVKPWLYCPALVWATEGMSSDEAIESLRTAIPPDLVSGIGYSFL